MDPSKTGTTAERRWWFPPRTLGQLMTLVALAGLGLAAVTPKGRTPLPPRVVPTRWFSPQSPAVRFAPLTERAGPDDRFVVTGPARIDEAFIVQAPEGFDDGMIAPAFAPTGRPGNPRP